MSITGYVLKGCGTDDWVGKETLTSCIITEIGREYGEGVTRTIKGVALHHKILDGTGSNKKVTTTVNAGATYNLGESILATTYDYLYGNIDANTVLTTIINTGIGITGQ